MTEREPRVYFIPETKDRKAMIVFDGGYFGGDIHVYEHKEAIAIKDIQKELQLPEYQLKELTNHWVEKNIGHAICYKLIRQ
jgi:hypothetical protein